MEITWFGHACCRLREKGVTVVADPCDKTTGYEIPRMRTDVVTVSHDDPHHGYVRACGGKPFVINGPGEYEVKGVFITGIPTYHGKMREIKSSPNTVYLYEFGGISVCHLGNLAHVPPQSQIEALGDIDVLLIPAGGSNEHLKAAEAAEIISLLEPKIVVPILYHTGRTTLKLASISTFLKEVGIPAPDPIESLKVAASTLPEETEIILLEPKQ